MAAVCGLLIAFAVALVAAAPTSAQEGAPQCSDGIDNDGDGLTDFPNDPQCVQNPEGGDPDGLSSDNSEADAGYQAFSGGGGPGGGSGGGGSAGSCDTTQGPATISNAFARPQGSGSWQPYAGGCLVQYQEQPDPTGGTMRYLVVSFTDQSGNQDLASLYPQGTEISVDIASSGPKPLFVLGSGNEMLVDPGPPMTVQGRVPRVEFAFQSGPGGINCAGGTQQMDFFGVVVQFEPAGGGQAAELMSSYAGAVIGTNAQSISFGGVNPDGGLGVEIDGCGANLFYEATLPIDGLSLGGLSGPLAQSLLSDLGPQGADLANLTELSDNDQQVPGKKFDSEFLSPNQVLPEPIPGSSSRRATRAAGKGKVAAVGVDYKTGFSPHDVTAAPDRGGVKAAKKAVKKCKKGKLKAAKGKLVCKKKRR